METKMGAVSRRPSKSLPSSSAPVSSSRIIFQEEANEEYRDNDNGVSEDTGSGQDNANNNKDLDGKKDGFDDEAEEGDDDDDNGCDRGVAGDFDNGLFPDDDEDEDTVEDDKFAGVNCIFRDCLGGESSYRCEGGSNQVLVCSEKGCPIAMHEVCMITEPTFDVTGKFYCPYCWYKREVARTEELRREVLLAKKEMSNFKLVKRDGGNGKKQEDEGDNVKEASLSTMAGKKDSGNGENGLNDDANETMHHNQEHTTCVESISKEKSEDKSISDAHGFDNVADGQRMQEEDIENTSDSENDGNDDDPQLNQQYDPNHFEIVDDTLCLSTKGTSSKIGVLEDKQGKRKKEEPVLPNEVGTSMTLRNQGATSKVPAIESFEFGSPDLDTGTPVVRQKRIKHTVQKARPRKVNSPKYPPSFQPSPNAKENKTSQQGKATTGENSVQCPELTKQIRSPTLGSGKRRRLYWTTEEEDMLKEGVRRFSLTMNKNIPWRKILEFGHNVFGNNRVPADLKDKWKKIMAKEDPKHDNGVLINMEK